MQVDFAFICQNAIHDSTVNAIGIGFDEIPTAEVPYTHRDMSLVAKLRFSRPEEGNKKFSLTMMDSDGGEIHSPLEATIEVEIPEGRTEGSVPFVVGIQDVNFPGYGEYAIHATVDGIEAFRVPFSVVAFDLP